MENGDFALHRKTFHNPLAFLGDMIYFSSVFASLLRIFRIFTVMSAAVFGRCWWVRETVRTLLNCDYEEDLAVVDGNVIRC